MELEKGRGRMEKTYRHTKCRSWYCHLWLWDQAASVNLTVHTGQSDKRKANSCSSCPDCCGFCKPDRQHSPEEVKKRSQQLHENPHLHYVLGSENCWWIALFSCSVFHENFVFFLQYDLVKHGGLKYHSLPYIQISHVGFTVPDFWICD